MKDLKHYFASPKSDTSPSEVPKELENDVIIISDVGEKADEVTKSSKGKFKKKRKRKLIEEEDVSSLDIINEPVDKKKRKKSVDVLKTKILVTEHVEVKQEPKNEEEPKHVKKRKNSVSASKKSCDSSSSKENSQSDFDEKDCSTPDSSKSLLKYFCKVDKLPEIPEKPRVVKVEVLVHADLNGSPPLNGLNAKRTSSIKKKKARKVNQVVDFDSITSEDIPPDKFTADTPKSSRQIDSGESLISSSDVVIIDDENRVRSSESGVQSKSQKSRLRNRVDKAEEESNRKTLGNEETCKEGKIDKDDVVFVKSIPAEDKKKLKHNGKEETSKYDNKDDRDDVIFVKSEPPNGKQKVKHDGTLASFFNLGKKGTVVSQESNIAKQLFLASSAPQCIKRITSASSVQGRDAPFPTKSHIQQKDKMNILWNLSRVNINFISPNSVVTVPPWTPILDTKSDRDFKPPLEVSCNTKTGLKELKKELNLFPIGCWQKELKKMKKSGEGLLWTERYRPRLSSGFLANTRSISRLKLWLSELMESSNNESEVSSSDEFVQDDDIKKSERKTVVLLTGPPGTGKTAAVYAIAEEIGYNVLEINAASNRSGKRILNEFSEAMKSHKVGVSKLNFTKVKMKIENPKRNLILIEDADLLFDDDEGFVSTLMTLGASTKRPIVLVANNPNAKHFTKLAPLFHSIIPFVPPTHDRLGSWLRTVSLVEGFQLCHEESQILASSLDLRKSLLQLQLLQASVRGNSFEDRDDVATWKKVGCLDLSSKDDWKRASRVYRALTTVDLLREERIQREAVPYWYKNPEDSTLTSENRSLPPVCLDDIQASLLGLVSSELPSTSSYHHFEIPRNLLDVEKDACSMTGVLNRRSLCLDIWPTLRHISRTEAVRLASHTKRNNRFFNYLASVGVKGPPDLLQSFSTTFSALEHEGL